MKLPPPLRPILRLNTFIVLICLVLTGAVWYIAVERARFEHAEAVANEFRQNANIAIALEEHAVGPGRDFAAPPPAAAE